MSIAINDNAKRFQANAWQRRPSSDEEQYDNGTGGDAHPTLRGRLG